MDWMPPQGEVLALKARLRGAEREVKELTALTAGSSRATARHGGSKAGEDGAAVQAIQQYVPISALHSLEKAHGESEAASASLRAAMVGARMRQAAAREAFVDHWERIRSAVGGWRFQVDSNDSIAGPDT